MLEILKFIFSSFWIWLGFTITFGYPMCLFAYLPLAILRALAETGRSKSNK